jgi:hypothetical protein
MFAGFTAFTWFHTILSLIMLVSGIVVTFGMIGGKRCEGWMGIYLVTAVLTNATGFGFTPVTPLMPSHYVGILSLVLLAIALLARYAFHLAGAWRAIFAVMIVLTVYFDAFVFVVQIFRKVPGLGGDQGPVFGAVQGVVFVVFLVLTILAARRYPRAA